MLAVQVAGYPIQETSALGSSPVSSMFSIETELKRFEAKIDVLADSGGKRLKEFYLAMLDMSVIRSPCTVFCAYHLLHLRVLFQKKKITKGLFW